MRNLPVGLFLAAMVAFGLGATGPGCRMPVHPSRLWPRPPVPSTISLACGPCTRPQRSGNISTAHSLADPPDMTEWAKEKYEAAKPSNGPRTHPLKETDDPILKSCLPAGVPRIYLHPVPMEIVQTPKETLLLYEYDHTVRRVFTDGRKHTDDITPTYMGESIGHWDADSFVVDTIGFNDKTWLDRDGHAHSDQLHVIELFHRTDRDNMQIDITMEDPKALIKPWVTQLFYQLRPQWDILELVCADNAAFLDFEK